MLSMSDLNPESAVVQSVVDEKKEKMIEYIRALKTIEDAMEPYKEQRRELRQEFKEQGWLDKEEIRVAVRAYRLLKGNVDIDQLISIYDSLHRAAHGNS